VTVPFAFTPLRELPEVVLVEPRRFADPRGWFEESFKRSDFAAHGIAAAFVQDNHAHSEGIHVLRGLHYQKARAAQGKLVRCVRGEIFDVAMDIRRGSPTYGRWASATLSEATGRQLWIPPGFAHGLCTLTPVADVLYKVTHEYAPAEDRAIRWDDPAIGIAWPAKAPLLSPKDAAAPRLAEADNDFAWEAAP
jgi:dTDP-4-dehydrorhamnose 3,5-epimerase